MQVTDFLPQFNICHCDSTSVSVQFEFTHDNKTCCQHVRTICYLSNIAVHHHPALMYCDSLNTACSQCLLTTIAITSLCIK